MLSERELIDKHGWTRDIYCSARIIAGRSSSRMKCRRTRARAAAARLVMVQRLTGQDASSRSVDMDRYANNMLATEFGPSRAF